MFVGNNNSAVLARGEKKRAARSKFASDLQQQIAQVGDAKTGQTGPGLGQTGPAGQCLQMLLRVYQHTTMLCRRNQTIARWNAVVDEKSSAWFFILSWWLTFWQSRRAGKGCAC